MHKKEAAIVDIFSSLQGEGIFLGAKQVFVRFGECNLDCGYCDEPRGARAERYTTKALLEKIAALDETKGAHHSVSLTGGEPLCYVDFLEELLPLLRASGRKSYLETNGTLPGALRRVIDRVDIVAMDIKLPSSTLGRAFWTEHAEFLKIALKRKVFVKAVVTGRTTADDIERAVRLVAQLGTNIPFILQPATAARKTGTPPKERLLEFVEIAQRRKLDTVKVVTQMHKVWGIK